MFRSLARDVVLQRSIAHQRLPTHRRGLVTGTLYTSQRCNNRRSTILSPSLTRFLSTPTPTPTKTTPTDSVLPTSPAPRKLKVELRPGPIKPKASTTSATHIPTKPTTPLPRPSSSSTPTPSLGTVKETAKRDIEDAEAHGILKPPPPDANWFKRTLHKGIELAKFYYRGVKLIFIRRKEINMIRARIKNGGAPLSRWENRLIRTQKDDVNKVIPFLFIALLLEEVIPLIAIYAPFMLPSTCILPSQRARIEEKRTEKAISFATTYRHIYGQLKAAEGPAGHLSINVLRQPDAATAVCGLLRLSTVGFDALRVRRIRRHLDFLAVDDQLLVQDNLLHNLPEKSLDEALEERGIITQGLTMKAKENRLKWWLDSVGASAPETRRLLLLMTRQH